MINRFFKIAHLLFLSIFLFSCGSSLSDDPIPARSFPPIYLNLSLPEFTNIQRVGGYKYINGGVRGIIAYRASANKVLAFERNCTYQPGDACATIDVHSSGLYMTDTCCGSLFRFEDGAPNGGPAWRPMQQYSTSLNGNTLTITDDIVN